MKLNNNSLINTIDDNLTCDYLIVGSGAGGSVAANELVNNNKDCILIEEGNYYSIDHFKGSMRKAMVSAWRNAGFTPIVGKPSFGYGEGMCLGGSTYVNGALLWRTPEIILNKWEKSGIIEGYNFQNLNKHYEKIEKKLNVVPENTDDGMNIDSKIIHELAKKKGIKSVYAPRAIKNCKRENNCATGCSSGAKQSVLQGYLVEASYKSLRVITNTKAIKINYKSNKAVSLVAWHKTKKKKFQIKFKTIILACGPIQTPMLLKRSFGNKIYKNKMQVHLNFRITTMFKKEINAHKGTIATNHIHEFLKEGSIFMSSNFSLTSLYTSNLKIDNKELNKISDKINQTTTFVLQTKPESVVNIKNFFGKPFLSFNLSSKDFNEIKEKLRFFCNFLFDAGADNLILPFKNNYYAKNISESNSLIDNLKINNLEMLSVHGMGSCPISVNKNSFFNNNGQSNLIDNLYGVDASILPSNIGSNPQETIMAFAHEILDRMKLN